MRCVNWWQLCRPRRELRSRLTTGKVCSIHDDESDGLSTPLVARARSSSLVLVVQISSRQARDLAWPVVAAAGRPCWAAMHETFAPKKQIGRSGHPPITTNSSRAIFSRACPIYCQVRRLCTVNTFGIC